MLNIQNEVVKLMQASLNSALCLSSHAIDTFASALGYSDCPQERERLGEPTLVKSDAKRLDWWSLIQALCSMTQRAVVAIDAHVIGESTEIFPPGRLSPLRHTTTTTKRPCSTSRTVHTL